MFVDDTVPMLTEVLKCMGFARRVLLQPNAMPTLPLPSVQPRTVPQQNLQRQSTSAASSITSAEAMPSTFQPERGSTPSPTDTMEPGEEQPPVAEPSPTGDATMDLDEQERPTAETNVAFPLTSAVYFASDQAEKTPEGQHKLLVFENNLRELLAVCLACDKPCLPNFTVVGSMLYVDSKCHDTTCHGTAWQRLPLPSQLTTCSSQRPSFSLAVKRLPL